MSGALRAFQIKIGNKILDYRLGKNLDLELVRTFFEKKYVVRKIWSGGRHIFGILEKNNKTLFLKLSTTEGISETTKNEYYWNEQYNKLVPRNSSVFWVPQNESYGLFQNTLFYLITDKFEGELICPEPKKVNVSKSFINSIPSIIRFTDLIQELNINLPIIQNYNNENYFLEKTKTWYNGIPKNILDKYKISELLDIVENNISLLQKKTKHGDFAPWHLISLGSNLGLIDGEHATNNGVENYDIGYFIQRVFSVLQNPSLAKQILSILLNNGTEVMKLKVILAARGIGGFLDESLKASPDYKISNGFKKWVLSFN